MEYVSIPSTVWSQISNARHHDEVAMNAILKKYRAPVYAFIRNMGADREEAEDLTQEVFLRLVRENVLQKADRIRGRFRSFLLAVVRHTVQTRRRDRNRLKRGGAVAHRPLEKEVHELLTTPPEPDGSFDPVWVQNLVRLALERLKKDCERRGSPHFDALVYYTEHNLTYAEIAERLDTGIQDVKNLLHHARSRLRDYVLAEIQLYSSSATEYEEEVAYLSKFLR